MLFCFRLQSNKTVKYVRFMTHFMSLFVVKHGVPLLTQSMDQCQPGVFAVVLEKIWCPNFLEQALQLSDSEEKVKKNPL